jgi:hypothetical protein
MQIPAKVNFGEDLGQNLGTVLEARDRDGRVMFGAGFMGLFNTRFRMDRWTLQFFVRHDDAEVTYEKLPFPSDDGGNYLFDLDGKVYQFSDLHDRTARWWNEETGAWIVDERFGVRGTAIGEGMMRLAGKLLQFKGGEVWYDGEKILTKPGEGHYHHFYYAHGHLVFYQNNDPDWSKLHAVAWRPGEGALDLDKAITLDLRYAGEASYAIGQLGDEVIQPSNLGGVYAFDGSGWRIIHQSLKGVSHQLYSKLNWYDRMLIGHYPTGNLFEYEHRGKALRHLEDCPPVMPGVSDVAREAQTTCLFGGDLYVGVWPWAELWRYDHHGDRWSFVRRMFEHPEITDKMQHPWEDRVVGYNEIHGEEIVRNVWGNRTTGLVPMGDALFISTGAKDCAERDMRMAFLHDDEVWNEYRTVHRMRKPGCAAGPAAWGEGGTTLTFVAEADRIAIAQDGNEIAAAPADPDMIARMSDAEIEWGTGMFGPFAGEIQT